MSKIFFQIGIFISLVSFCSDIIYLIERFSLQDQLERDLHNAYTFYVSNSYFKLYDFILWLSVIPQFILILFWKYKEYKIIVFIQILIFINLVIGYLPFLGTVSVGNLYLYQISTRLWIVLTLVLGILLLIKKTNGIIRIYGGILLLTTALALGSVYSPEIKPIQLTLSPLYSLSLILLFFFEEKKMRNSNDELIDT